MNVEKAIGVDIGGTKISFGAVDGITQAQLKNDAGIIGAAYLAFQSRLKNEGPCSEKS
jgi:predicted NBD/HSP70 family sugar kinase